MSVKVLPMSMLIVLPMSVLRAVRGEKAKSFEFPKLRFPESKHLQLSDAQWDLEPNPISRSSRGNEALIFFPENALGLE